MIDNLMKELEDAQKLEGSADEKKIRTALKAIGINYDKLTEDERKPVSYTHLHSGFLFFWDAERLYLYYVFKGTLR